MSRRSKRVTHEAATPRISTPAPRLTPDSSRSQAGRDSIDFRIAKIQELVSRSPDKAAIILTEWLKRPGRISKKRNAA